MFDKKMSKKANNEVIVGMSISNGFFSKEENIKQILKQYEEMFSSVHIMISDVIGAHTLRAKKGYKKSKSEKKARLSGNAIRNKIQSTKYADTVDVIDWNNTVTRNPFFQEKYKKIMLMYKNIESFRDDVRSTVKDVIEKDSEREINLALPFLLKELAFLEASPDIFQQESITYGYHNEWPIFQNFISGKYDQQARNNIHFEVVKPK